MTQDIDLVAEGTDINGAMNDLVHLAQADLGDLVTFECDGSRPIKQADAY